MIGCMNPFELPPTSSPVSVDPPTDVPVTPPAAPPGRSRRRVVLATIATAGLFGGGVLGLGQLTSADTPDAPAASPAAPIDEPTSAEPTSDDATTDEPTTDEPTTDETRQGEIVIDVGDGDPIVIDLGELDTDALERLAECSGLPLPDRLPRLDRLFDDDRLGELEQRLDEVLGGMPPLLPELGGLGLYGDGSRVTIIGPDGVSIVDLGDGDASVTITQQDGELSIEADGDATVDALPPFGEMLDRILPPDLDPGALEECLSGLG
jgi:hypothetical protein